MSRHQPERPVLPKRPARGLDAVVRTEARCAPEDVIANRLDPWHGAHFHPHSFARLSLLDRGFVFVVALIRGGGEMGRAWYEMGKMAQKPTTFSDFVTCGRWFVENGWTTSEHFAARGGSAGGLLASARSTRRA